MNPGRWRPKNRIDGYIEPELYLRNLELLTESQRNTVGEIMKNSLKNFSVESTPPKVELLEDRKSRLLAPSEKLRKPVWHLACAFPRPWNRVHHKTLESSAHDNAHSHGWRFGAQNCLQEQFWGRNWQQRMRIRLRRNDSQAMLFRELFGYYWWSAIESKNKFFVTKQISGQFHIVEYTYQEWGMSYFSSWSVFFRFLQKIFT